jgi:NADPH:quinone reductase-like Zn-dependent oxidoreductase
MKALANKGDGGMHVEMVEVPEPEPRPNEAVVEVRAVAVNRGELRLLRARPQGWRPGQDVAGVVAVAAGDGSGPAPGSRVVAWPEQGGWAQRVPVPTSHLAVLAPEVSFAQAASLPIAALTALRALRIGGDLTGRRVLITGAAGGVGRFAVELAARAGATVIGVVADDSRATGLDELGVSGVVHDIDDADGPFDLILESTGGRSLEGAVRAIAPGGTVVMFGNSSDTPASISFGDFRGKAGARLVAFFVYESGEPPSFGADLQLLADMVAEGTLHPQIGLETSWSEADSVFEKLAQRQVNGKAVLIVD